MRILADASLPALQEAFPDPFQLTLYNTTTELVDRLKNQEILLCRSTLEITQELLHGHRLRFIATASSGTNHIDKVYLADQGISLISAKGSNANSVADYIVANLAFLQKYKEFTGNKAAVIGIGAVGRKVVERLNALQFEVIVYDPPRQERDPDFFSFPLETIMDCDLICIHANLHDKAPCPSRDLFNERLLHRLKPGCVIINASRGGIVNEKALLAQYNLIYCTDVFANEPSISKAIVEFSTLCTPHIAGHSMEAKYAAVMQVSQTLHGHYKLQPPAQVTPFPPQRSEYITENWLEYVLSLYNPFNETQYLKAAKNLSRSFLDLRKAHQYRHDFSAYLMGLADRRLKLILGL